MTEFYYVPNLSKYQPIFQEAIETLFSIIKSLMIVLDLQPEKIVTKLIIYFKHFMFSYLSCVKLQNTLQSYFKG